jgi:sporulation protein YhbH
VANVYFTLQKEDWSLHRKGQQDQERHKEKVKQAIKDNLADLVSDESLILSDGHQIVKVPIRSLDEYRIRYNFQKGRQAGTGQGDSQVGDVIAKGRDPKQQQPGKGEGAGEQPGVDYTEAGVALEEIQALLFEELELPDLADKSADEMVTDSYEFRDVRKKGLSGNIDKKRTLLEAIRRNALNAKPSVQIIPEDLRYKTWEDVEKPDSNAVILAMMDLSGSLDVAQLGKRRAGAFGKTPAQSLATDLL